MKYLPVPLVLLLIIAASCRHGTPITVDSTKDTLLIYLMAGQSNMAGRGTIEPQDMITDNRIFSMDAGNQFVIAHEPLNFYQPGLSGLDCGLSFSHALLPYTKAGTKIGLVQCAVGSTSVEEWLYDSLRIVPLYTNLVTRAREGTQRGLIKGILWHLGESNAENTSCYQYAANMQALIRNWRRDLNDDHLPVFMAKLATFCKRPYREEVNAAIDETARAMPDVYVIATADLTCKPDSIHFDSPSQRLMGQRFAAYARLLLH